MILAVLPAACAILSPAAAAQEDDAPTLRTAWAAEVDPRQPWPEHPDPGLVRGTWGSLNGSWEYAITEREIGEPEQWDGEILVPFAVESALSGVERAVSPEECLWYRRSLAVPDAGDGRVLLHFGAVDWDATVWVNGERVGRHQGGYDAFTLDVTEALAGVGEAELRVRVGDPTDAGPQPRGKQVLAPEGIWYTAVTGIWQSVWWEVVPRRSIARLARSSDVPAGALRVTAEGRGTAGAERVRAVARAEGREVGRAEGGLGEALSLEVAAPRLWSPGDPFLYDLEVELLDGEEVLDRVQSYAALRSVERRPDAAGHERVFLNGEPVFLFGPLDQGWWPDGLYTAPTDAALRFDVEQTKALGFNACRKHVKVEPARWYWWCDRLGLLVLQDMPSGDGFLGPGDPDLERSPESAAAYRREWEAIVRQLSSHPCIVAWVPFNEGWGQFETAEILAWTGELDPTRLVDGPSGWTDRGTGDLLDCHSYPEPRMFPLEPGRVAIAGEYGGLGLLVPGHLWRESMRHWGYRTLPDADTLLASYEELAFQVRRLRAQGLGAAIYTQTSDVEGEVNGLFTYDRAVLKMDRARLVAVNRSVFLPPPRETELVPTSAVLPRVWRYLEGPPPEGWSAPDLDDSGWREGTGGFGTPETPGAVVGTAWASSEITIRRAFELGEVAAGRLALSVHHDEDVEVFLNGAPVYARAGYRTAYTVVPLPENARELLRPGRNVLAAHCRQTAGGQFLDVGLVLLEEAGGAARCAVPFPQVHFTDDFWAPRLRTNRDVTIPYAFGQCETTGRIRNFAVAGGLEEGDFEGRFYNDSDVYKVLEGAAYSLTLQPDPELDAYLDDLIAKIAAAQEDDGYLYTLRTIRGSPLDDPGAGPERWSRLSSSHELYNLGHLYEAAVAHHAATGKRALLDVALESAALVRTVFGPEEGQRKDPPGHQEIEIGLMRLAQATGDAGLADLARFFLEQRGRFEGRESYGAYSQDHLPVLEQEGPVGHAVRALYQYAAMADVAAATGDPEWTAAVDRLWERIQERHLYVTGGVGARAEGEAFGEDFELPNAAAYNETCAAIANALFQQRMFLLHGSIGAADTLERVLYNGFLSGVSLSGDRFFYPNPLACDATGEAGERRSPWFDCACCPVNVARFLPSIPGMVYAVEGNELWINLFVQGSADVPLASGSVRVEQRTRYPWDGNVEIQLDPGAPREFTVHLRIPGWARGEPVAGGLYRCQEEPPPWHLREENMKTASAGGDGQFTMERRWKPGETLRLEFPMPVQRLVCDERVAANHGRVALQRGPLVYCFESIDQPGGGDVKELFLPDGAEARPRFAAELLGGVMVLEVDARRVVRGADGEIHEEPVKARAVPYHVWGHRDQGSMAVWLPRTAAGARPRLPETLASRSRASASHCFSRDTVAALHDRIEPASSADASIPRLTFWDHRGTEEWLEYRFPERTRVHAVEVYWFDDPGSGQCRVPRAWRLLHRDGEEWRPVSTHEGYGVAADAPQRVEFEPVETEGLRLEVSLAAGFSAGVLEWSVE